VENLEQEDITNVEKMELTREVVSAILDERVKSGIKVRQPLASATIDSLKYSEILNDENYLKEIKDEVNIREIKIGTGEKVCVLDTNITDELKMEGTYRELVRMIQDKRKEANLKVSDIVSIVLPESMSDFEKQVVESKREELQKDCGLKEISFGSELKIV
jgi:isoleucyl-tRNA synthetase